LRSGFRRWVGRRRYDTSGVSDTELSYKSNSFGFQPSLLFRATVCYNAPTELEDEPLE